MKNAACFILIVLVFLFTSTIPGFAVSGGSWHGGGGWHDGGSWHGGGGWHGGIWIGPGWGWGPWWWGPPYYPYYYPNYPYYYPYYPETHTFIQQQPPVHVQPENQYYWYFCRKPEGYYPYVKRCPSGWLKVLPPAAPGAEE